MAIIDCDECGNEVSDKAATCPHCGAKVKKKMRPVEKFLAVTLSVLVFLVFFAAGSDEEPTTQVDNEPEEKIEECTTNACLADDHMIHASVVCKRQIERHAKYQAEWTDGLFEMIFARYSFNEAGDVISYFGDKVKFQNGFGAWSNMIYKCEYNIETGSVVGTEVEEGRL